MSLSGERGHLAFSCFVQQSHMAGLNAADIERKVLEVLGVGVIGLRA